jgi:hypothetical protein
MFRSSGFPVTNIFSSSRGGAEASCSQYDSMQIGLMHYELSMHVWGTLWDGLGRSTGNCFFDKTGLLRGIRGLKHSVRSSHTFAPLLMVIPQKDYTDGRDAAIASPCLLMNVRGVKNFCHDHTHSAVEIACKNAPAMLPCPMCACALHGLSGALCFWAPLSLLADRNDAWYPSQATPFMPVQH